MVIYYDYCRNQRTELTSSGCDLTRIIFFSQFFPDRYTVYFNVRNFVLLLSPLLMSKIKTYTPVDSSRVFLLQKNN